MAIEQLNYGKFKYVDDSAVSWNKRGEVEGVRQAVDGSAAAGAFPDWGRETRLHATRKIIYQDATTFRTKTVQFYTAAAWAAITLGTSTLTFTIPGTATGVVYTAARKIPERQRGTASSPHLGEHA